MSNKTYITDDHNLNDSSIAASSKAVKTAYDRASTAIDNATDAKNASITGLSVSGKTITYTKGDGTTGTITTQDTDTTYSAGTGISISGTTISTTTFNSSGQLAFPDGSTMWIA